MKKVISYMGKDFFKINLGHILVLTAWMVTFSYGYGSLNNRVTINTAILTKLQEDRTITTDRSLEDQKKLVAEMAILNSKMSTIGNDVEWLKKNTK